MVVPDCVDPPKGFPASCSRAAAVGTFGDFQLVHALAALDTVHDMEHESNTWYYARNGQQRGPYTSAQLKSLVASGVITASDLVWNDELPDWVPASQVTRLWAVTPGRRTFPAPPAHKESPGPPALPPSIALQNAAGQVLMQNRVLVPNKGINPFAALAASFFCLPLGHIFLGQTTKGMLLTLATLIGTCLCLVPGILIGWMTIFDSYVIAQAIRDGKQVYDNEYKIELLYKIMKLFDKTAIYHG
jgi:hypothetical protein